RAESTSCTTMWASASRVVMRRRPRSPRKPSNRRMQRKGNSLEFRRGFTTISINRRFFGEKNLLFSHVGSYPLCPGRQSVSVPVTDDRLHHGGVLGRPLDDCSSAKELRKTAPADTSDTLTTQQGSRNFWRLER